LDSAGFDKLGTSRNLPELRVEQGNWATRRRAYLRLTQPTFSGPWVWRAAELALGPSGLITLAAACEVDGGALLEPLGRVTLDVHAGFGTLSRVDGDMR
jgi:hypothetical protein